MRSGTGTIRENRRQNMKRENKGLPRMRTINEAVAWLQENDPDTAFTQTALRRLIVSGKLPSVKIGQKYLINLDTMEDYLQGCSTVSKKTRESGR